MSKSEKHFDIAVIGGGAAGLFCSVLIKSRKPELSVAVIEAQDRVGKKLLTTGNGRCNLTNLYNTPDMYHGTFKKGAEYLLELCPPTTVVGLFEELGLLTYAEDDGRVYPVSKQANSVLDILRITMDKLGVHVILSNKVIDIKKNKDSFRLECIGTSIHAERVVVSSGSKSTPSTGADDSLLYKLKTFGHSVVSPVPALCPVLVDSPYLKSLKGIRASGCVRIIKDNKVLREEYGEIQFTENALSGICVFNLARIANTEKDTVISLSLLPEKSYGEILELLKRKRQNHNSAAKAEELLIGFFNRMLGIALLKSSGISPGKEMKDISDNEIKKLASVINDWQFKVIPANDFSRSQVTAGGINGKEIEPKTMRSIKTDNLYLIGEAVDCDGDCGGMNLQFAFASAYCAACDITL